MPIKSHKLLTSKDKLVSKALLTLSDNAKIETVLIKHASYNTACISSQVGCALGCIFCATGQGGFVRNLEVDEIVGQIDFWNQLLAKEKSRVKNVVFMGMGEPFLNWENVKQSLKIINSPEGPNIGQRKITVSTCGITDKIREFAKEKAQINLAISLHSAVNSTRTRIMPINKKYPLQQLTKACLDYVKQTNRKLFFEYTLLNKINDTDKEIKSLITLINKHYLFHLNIIPYNTTGGDFQPTPKKQQSAIVQILKRNNVSFTVRKSFGSDILAACGQLKAMEEG